MRTELLESITAIYADITITEGHALNEIFKLVKAESERGYGAGDADSNGSVIIGVIPDLDGVSLTTEQKINLAIAFNDNYACRQYLIDAVEELLDMGEDE
jgi:hypothetical protein